MGDCHLLCYTSFHTRVDRVCPQQPHSGRQSFGLCAVLPSGPVRPDTNSKPLHLNVFSQRYCKECQTNLSPFKPLHRYTSAEATDL